MYRSAVMVGIVCALYTSVAKAQQVELMDLDTVREKFETSISVLNEEASSADPPTYRLSKATVEFSVVSGASASGSAKIPLGVIGAEFSGEYEEVATEARSFVYTASSTIPTNFDDLGVLDFLSELQSRTARKMEVFQLTSAMYSESFVAAVDGRGKISFIGLASLGADLSIKNSHKMTFEFCLVDVDNECAD